MTRAAGPLVEAEGSRLHPPFHSSNNGGRPTWDRRSCRWIILTAGAARPLTSATRHLDEGTRRKTCPQTQGAGREDRAERGEEAAITSSPKGAALLCSLSSWPTGSATLPAQSDRHPQGSNHHSSTESLIIKVRRWSSPRRLSFTFITAVTPRAAVKPVN